MSDDYQPGGATPADDPMSDPAEADLEAQLDAARELIARLRPVTAVNVKAFLEPDALEAAAVLREHDVAYFFRLHEELRPHKVLRIWLHAIATTARGMGEGEQKISEKTRLIAIAKAQLDLWHDGADAWCWPKEHGPACSWRMPSGEAKRYLLAQYGERNQVTLEGGRKAPMTPGRQAVGEAMDQLEAMAYSGPRRRAPALRVGGDGSRLVLDLCRDDYAVVVVENGGWEVTKPSPLAMRRAPGMQPLPLPVEGGGDALGELRRLLNFEGTEHASFWALFVGFMFAALRPVAPYFVFGLAGDQGTGKSTTARIVRAPVDPHEVDIQPKPKSEDDLFVNADSQWLNAYDNLSTLDQHWSDAFCRISTGTGYSKRKLCTDRETARFKVARPQIITAIVDVVAAPDLLDRSLLAQQPDVGVNADEDELYAAVGELAPRVLGQLLDAAAVALKRQRKVELHRVPRMVGPDEVGRSGRGSARARVRSILERLHRQSGARGRDGDRSRAWSAAHLSMLAARDAWAKLGHEGVHPYVGPVGFEGTAGQLLHDLNEFMTGRPYTRGRGWPGSPRGMSAALKRVAPAMRKLGYTVSFARQGRGNDQHRIITVATPATKAPTIAYNANDRSHRSHRSPTTPAAAAPGNVGNGGNDGNGRKPTQTNKGHSKERDAVNSVRDDDTPLRLEPRIVCRRPATSAR